MASKSRESRDQANSSAAKPAPTVIPPTSESSGPSSRPTRIVDTTQQNLGKTYILMVAPPQRKVPEQQQEQQEEPPVA